MYTETALYFGQIMLKTECETEMDRGEENSARACKSSYDAAPDSSVKELFAEEVLERHNDVTQSENYEIVFTHKLKT